MVLVDSELGAWTSVAENEDQWDAGCMLIMLMTDGCDERQPCGWMMHDDILRFGVSGPHKRGALVLALDLRSFKKVGQLKTQAPKVTTVV